MENSERKQLDLKRALEFIFAGKAFFTIKSNVTDKHFTYKIESPKNNDNVHFVSLLTGTDNENNYTFFGTIFNKKEFRHGKKSTIKPESKGVIAFNWVFKNILSDTIHDKITFYHEGCCCKCGRKLTHPESIETGIGPECAKRIKK